MISLTLIPQLEASVLFATVFTWRVCCLNDLSSCLRTVDSHQVRKSRIKNALKGPAYRLLLGYPVEIPHTGGPLEPGTLSCIYSGGQGSRLDLVTAHYCSNGSEQRKRSSKLTTNLTGHFGAYTPGERPCHCTAKHGLRALTLSHFRQDIYPTQMKRQ